MPRIVIQRTETYDGRAIGYTEPLSASALAYYVKRFGRASRAGLADLQAAFNFRPRAFTSAADNATEYMLTRRVAYLSALRSELFASDPRPLTFH